jgi:mitochondrial protein import protein ZIM17
MNIFRPFRIFGRLSRLGTLAISNSSISSSSPYHLNGKLCLSRPTIAPWTYNDNIRLFSSINSVASDEVDENKEVSGKMMMLFTCKICSTRVGKTFSKLAYKKGIVIIQCPGCQKRHLVADNLGWFRHFQGRNVEDYLRLKNERIMSGDIELTEQDIKLLEQELGITVKDDLSGSNGPS